MAALLKLALVPLVVWLASVAGRRWGHAATGWISGLPLIAGPISVFLALDQGVQFAADAAAATLQVTGAAALHCFVFAHASRRFGWLASLLLGWASFVAGAALLGAVPMPPLAGAGVTAVALGADAREAAGGEAGERAGADSQLGARGARHRRARDRRGGDPRRQSLRAARLGHPARVPDHRLRPAAFALALHGSNATVRLLAGFLSGLFAFAAFHLVIATALPALGVLVGFPVAFAAGLVAAGVVMRVRALAEPR